MAKRAEGLAAELEKPWGHDVASGNRLGLTISSLACYSCIAANISASRL
jgi:hypothetical protein